ncbi:MAG: GNAT family N-acetyltransferase [Pseudomonadota bacterium]
MTDQPATVTLSDTPVIETERLILRAPVAGDWPFWASFFTSDRARFIGGEDNREKAWRAFGHVIGHWVLRGCGNFIITLKTDSRPVGEAGPWYPDGWPEREIGWSLWDPAIEGTGIAAEAAIATRAHAYTALGWPSAVSYVAHGNDRSARLAERLGCTLDPAAATPRGEPCHVWRHPSPAALAA